MTAESSGLPGFAAVRQRITQLIAGLAKAEGVLSEG